MIKHSKGRDKRISTEAENSKREKKRKLPA
jgi:hypothetical protein